ncbi:multicopper oxidase-domain-containing protein [Apodospora peruviana]|uniref:Multicopper oxidase-domain-containing protein n=1 Tax=Apodospora peruviana TaxID=516989 RepID=A0AAE0HUP6_9PEZI|nr:multicopper oxidase-domain-containing protein [Apodospora peruviana]
MSVAGVSFSPSGASSGFLCHYPHLSTDGWEGCSSDGSRSCWLRQRRRSTNGSLVGYDINTNWLKFIQYTLDVSKKVISPTGVPKEAMVFNGQYPGPKIEACWGDELVVTVINLLPEMGTAIHWHGIRQLRTNHMDGVAITQCPVARGSNFTYRFRVTQYGSSWYHSHHSLQYGEGLAGSLVLYGPSSSNYDVAVSEQLFMSDWMHDSAFQRYKDEKDPAVRGASVDTILLNGMGAPAGSATASSDIRSSHRVITVVPGKKNRLWLCNGSVGTAFVFSIDGHNFTIIGNDFVPVRPYVTNSVVVAIGQRYEIVVDASANTWPSGNYWIRTIPADGCNRFKTGYFNSKSSPPTTPLDGRTGILHYDTSVNSSWSALPNTTTAVTRFDCGDVDLQKSLRPVIPWEIQRPLNDLALSTFYAAHQTTNDTGLGQMGNYAHWLLRLDPKTEKASGHQLHHPFWADFSRPTLLNLANAGTDPYKNVLRYTFNPKGGFIFMVIDGALLPTTSAADVNNTFSFPPEAHPMHWHGSDVVILGQDDQPFDPVRSPGTWDIHNPPRRDTVTMPVGGYVAVAFKPDNPGVWLIHCHIAWHASSGLALQMIIQGGGDDDDPNQMIYRTIGQAAVDSLAAGCRAWERDRERSDLKRMWQSDDSGI